MIPSLASHFFSIILHVPTQILQFRLMFNKQQKNKHDFMHIIDELEEVLKKHRKNEDKEKKEAK